MTAEEREFRRRATAIIRELDDLSPETMASVQRQVRRLREEIVAAIGREESWTARKLPAILAQIDEAIARWAGATTEAIGGSLDEAAGIGGRVADTFARIVRVRPVEMGRIVPEQIAAVRSGVGDLIVQVGADLRRKVANEIRAAALGVQRPFEAIEKVRAIIPGIRVPIRGKDGEVIGYRYAGPAARAETIVRTEQARVYSMASADRYQRMGVPGLLQEWNSALRPNSRDSHVAAHGQRRPVGEAFDVGGVSLRFPGDPDGPPGEVINCLCVLLPALPEWDEYSSNKRDGDA